MKEKLYTIPLHDAFGAGDECPFCFAERKIEQDMMDFVLGSGSSYMEGDVRAVTDREGFCRNHFKKMFDYGNTLGNAWIMKTHLVKQNQELHEVCEAFVPGKASFKSKFSKNSNEGNAIVSWAKEREESCYICKQIKSTYERYLDTFFVVYEKEEEFRQTVNHSKGFCIPHFGDLCNLADKRLKDSNKEDFYKMVCGLMEENCKRLEEEVSWLVEKFDYRNHDADWKNSKDALQRGMQKCKGAYPADPVYKINK